ncbi:MAG: trypsin-like serine protease [Gaiellaceae bacterium]
MRKSLVTGLLLAGALAFAAVALGITNGGPDGNGHPEVAAVLAPHAYSDGTWESCTGTLIAAKVVLTAAHCYEGLARGAVTFDSTYDAATGTTYWGTWHVDPDYNQAQGDPHDIAVIVLDKAPKGITPARLPTLDQLDSVEVNDPITAVGYGAQFVSSGPGGHEFHYADIRYVAVGSATTTTQVWLKASMNPATGDGGTCYGDSGGPNFLGAGSTETNIIGGTTITGDMYCRATNVTYRLDTKVARDFLGQFVTLP